MKTEISSRVTSYTIKDLEKLSGIKAHTIRAWEKRYHVIDPDRTDTNIRKYDDQALKKIMMISTLNNLGFKISRLADLSIEELQVKVNEIANPGSNLEIFIDQLVIAMIEMDEKSFSDQLRDLTNWFGFEKTVTEIFFPFCEKIGVLWLINKIHPAHEHFITNMIRRKLFAEVDKMDIARDPRAAKVILFLPEGEFHDIGLLFYNYLFRREGYQTIYLGQNLPLEDLREVEQFYNTDILVSAILTKMPVDECQEWVNKLSASFPDKKIVLSGQYLNEINIQYPSNVYHVPTARELSRKMKEGSI